MDITTLALLALAPILVWRVYTRLKGQLVRQRSIVARHYTGLLVFVAMVLVPASQLIAQPVMLGWLLVGAVGGIAYGVWGLRMTKYEQAHDGCYFTPPKRLGMAIAMLFFACLLYIAFEIFANQGSGAPTPRVTDYPFTLPSMGLAAGYFGTFSAGLLRWRRGLKKAIHAV